MSTQPRRAILADACGIAAVISLGVAVGLKATGHPDMQRPPMLAALTYGVTALLLAVSCDVKVVAGAHRWRRVWAAAWRQRFRRMDPVQVAHIQACAVQIAPANHAGESMARAYAWEFLHAGGRLGAAYASQMLDAYTQARTAVLVDRERRRLMVDTAIEERWKVAPLRIVLGTPLTADEAAGIVKAFHAMPLSIFVPAWGDVS